MPKSQTSREVLAIRNLKDAVISHWLVRIIDIKQKVRCHTKFSGVINQ